mmetsp:Transcript_60227/g.162232  ORF Transcript_60227/g.162232 Transcript_60227/m.162232 type:complete len:93 (-) Transcript_60227:1362-1640(-)
MLPRCALLEHKAVRQSQSKRNYTRICRRFSGSIFATGFCTSGVGVTLTSAGLSDSILRASAPVEPAYKLLPCGLGVCGISEAEAPKVLPLAK